MDNTTDREKYKHKQQFYSTLAKQDKSKGPGYTQYSTSNDCGFWDW